MRTGSRIRVAGLAMVLLGAATASAQEAKVVGAIADGSHPLPSTLKVVSASLFQLNLDVQPITPKLAGSSSGQSAFSRDAIAEFQALTSQFEITQGRSVGSQVQVVSTSGTNVPSGSLYGFFRNDALNAADSVPHRVRPYSDPQASGITIDLRIGEIVDATQAVAGAVAKNLLLAR